MHNLHKTDHVCLCHRSQSGDIATSSACIILTSLGQKYPEAVVLEYSGLVVLETYANPSPAAKAWFDRRFKNQ